MESPSPHRPQRQDTFDLREAIVSDEQSYLSQMQGETYPSDEEHSMIEDDSDPDERDGDYGDDDDRSSSLSIPNESIDFDLVYSLHSFAATVEGQASVVKGDSLVLMDDSNSYWWLVRVLKTQEIGYIPAENIETPFERLARLNKHRNVDLASPTQAEIQYGLQESRDHFRSNVSGSNQQTPSPTPGNDARVLARSRQHARRSVIFTPALQVHRYPPAVWGDDEEVDDDDEWDVGGYSDEDPSLAEEAALAEQERRGGGGGDSDDGMSWEEALPDPSRVHVITAEEQRLQQELQAQQLQQQLQQEAEQQAAQQHQQQQRQQIEEQRRQQQVIAQSIARQTSPTSTNRPAGLSIGPPDSREQLVPPQGTSPSSVSPSSSNSARSMDPVDASETKKMTITPSVVQDNSQHGQPLRQAPPRPGGPMLPSELMQRQEEDRKRTREEIEALETARKKVKSPPGGRSNGGPAKLRKDPQLSGDEDSGKENKKGKSGGLFGRLFDRRKDKHKEKGTNDSIDISRSTDTRSSEDSRSSGNHTDTSGGVYTPPRRGAAPASTSPPVSLHTTSLRQRDREQQALYQQQYLTRSPASPPEVQPLAQLSPTNSTQGATGFGGISMNLSPTVDGRRPRPGSLLIGGNLSGDGSSSVPELSVIRVFAGKKLQTEATFKTVLLNSSTTSEELVKQAIQRFRLPAGEDVADYYLTVKRLEGSFAELHPEEKPLVVFESLAEAALDLPKVKRSSVGSISSITSNLSQHPAIKMLPMNDFTDDTAVKIYLNRHSESASDESGTTEESDATTNAESVQTAGESGGVRLRPRDLSTGVSVTSERFSSPSFRFALQLLIYPDDLPEDMVFDPLTEAIVFKHTLRDRPHVTPSSAPFRRKIFVLPKNITVAEVIEISLERFGIPEGVVDGGDEVEDKNTKRRSSSRVRYALNVLVDGKERELLPLGKVIDAYPRPPSYRPAERRLSDSKRRSFDSMLLLGSPEDVSSEDPTFILRRAVTYRPSSSRHRLSAPLDEIALQKLHRESMSSSSATSEDGDTKPRHISKQELITAQRAVWRANQRAILSAQANSERGVDLLLPNNAVLRSSRYNTDERTRYSYVEGGETYDISDIMEEEWDSPTSAGQGDLLEGVLERGRARDGVDEKLHRVLSKIKTSRPIQRAVSPTTESTSTVESIYSDAGQGDESETPLGGSRSTTPVGTNSSSKADDVLLRVPSPASERTVTPDVRRQRSTTPSSVPQGRSTPQQQQQQQLLLQQQIQAPLVPHLRQMSTGSVMTDTSGYRTAVGSPVATSPSLGKVGVGVLKPLRKPKLTLPKDDFGVSHMMAIIELAGLQDRPPPPEPVHPIDEMLFGRSINMDELHPAIREIYEPSFKQLDEMDQMLDDLLQQALAS